MSGLALLGALLAPSVSGQFVPFIAPAVRNAASGTNSIAPGSYVAITVYSSDLANSHDLYVNLTTEDGVGVRLIPIFPSNPPNSVATDLWFLIPSNARLGSALVTVTLNGATSNTFIQIVAAAPGIFTNNGFGSGSALAVNHPSTPNALTAAAVPTSIVSLFATGLNGTPSSDIKVELAGQVITPLYAGPQGQPGLDQINFVVPKEIVLGCYVSVAIRVRGVLSNQSSISINNDPFACAHPLGLSYADLKTLDSGGAIPLAWLILSSYHKEPTWQESANLFFFAASASGMDSIAGVQTTDSQLFSCYVKGPTASVGAAGAPGRAPDPGAVTLSGPNDKRFDLTKSGQALNDHFFSAGLWKISGTGSMEMGAFQQEFILPPQLGITNLNPFGVIPSQGYTLTWDPSGFSASDVATVYLLPTASSNYSYATCSTPAASGQMILPDWVLENFKGQNISLETHVRPNPAARTLFSISATDGTIIRGFVDYNFMQVLSATVE